MNSLVVCGLIVLIFCTPSLAKSTPNQINITINSEDAKILQVKRREKYYFQGASISINGQLPVEAKLSTRGQNCLKAPRKCFSVKMSEKQKLNGLKKAIKKFNLISLWEDHGYISSEIGYTFYSEFDLYPFKRSFVEVFINDKPYGLYLLVEKPKGYFEKKWNSPYSARRKYNNRFETKNFDPELTSENEIHYISKLKELEENPDKLWGNKLYHHLLKRMNFSKYLQWNVLNSLTKNGDFTDEIWFVATQEAPQSEPYFEIYAWDLDDLFKLPHPGRYNDKFYKGWLENSLIYSFESRLERKIYKDKYIYERFLETMSTMLTSEITDEFIDQKINEVKKRLTPYITEKRVLAPSAIDGGRTRPYTTETILDLLEKRRRELKKRRRELLNNILEQR